MTTMTTTTMMIALQVQQTVLLEETSIPWQCAVTHPG